MKHQLVDNTAEELAKFLHCNRQLDPQKKREFLATRSAVVFFLELVTWHSGRTSVSDDW